MSKNRHKDEQLVSRFLDGELSPEEEKNALIRIAEDEELRAMLRFDRFLSDSLHEVPDLEMFDVPEGFTNDVMHQIEQMEHETARQPVWYEPFFEWMKQWFTPKEYTFRPAMVMATPALLLMLTAALFLMPSADETSLNEFGTETEFVVDHVTDEVWIRFVYIDDDASEMAVAGNFSDWEPIELDSRVMGDKTVWTGLVPVERGEHHYMFVKNGEEWLADPLAEIQRDDGFGNKNAVIYL
ncbi:hypothetical protein DYD21_14590 [Rhodohalobacter sp. SW132]|uniref:hypothetical protein n=1 Tax=Rhodohalobacter sp. SW132 TaxID=2293433 RepID=UPI000E2533CC|nr:hypothetical protein [Rhodohalobacter sp. SW132]REL29085.1 hypothetical protein DYD21_14590 [Rhodohalobacter sp. SW132]